MSLQKFEVKNTSDGLHRSKWATVDVGTSLLSSHQRLRPQMVGEMIMKCPEINGDIGALSLSLSLSLDSLTVDVGTLNSNRVSGDTHFCRCYTKLSRRFSITVITWLVSRACLVISVNVSYFLRVESEDMSPLKKRVCSLINKDKSSLQLISHPYKKGKLISIYSARTDSRSVRVLVPTPTQYPCLHVHISFIIIRWQNMIL